MIAMADPPEPAPAAGVKRALDKDQLTLFYQPIHDLESRAIVSAEALLRARRQTGEIRSAVPIAAGAELGPQLFRLDSWMMHQAYEDAGRWQKNGATQVRLNVNLSPREFQEGNVLPRLTKLMSSCGVARESVNLEITETAYIERPKQTMHIVEELKELGLQIWLDDFGTGHSSISHLLHFPLDGLKLPEEFIRRIAFDKKSREITRHIIELAHDLDMKVIAEGIEHNDQLATLRDFECDYIQGFLFSRPMPVEEFEDLVAK
jgi:EAL domain-containing protein (putative c-di-GMP-specific phosphodiesterase class I)